MAGQDEFPARNYSLDQLPQEAVRQAGRAEASGAKFMSEEELNVYQEWLREPGDMDETLRQAKEEHRRQEPT
jgi:hypothetical protein